MDWNAGETLSKTKTELLHIMVLECVYNLEQNINTYYMKKSLGQNSTQELSSVKGFLVELTCRLMTPLGYKLEEFKAKLGEIRNADIDQILTIYYDFEFFLYEKGLTKWDNIKQKQIKDPHNPEEFVKEEQRVRSF